ncbi:hypothetical protein PDG61_17940 [Mycolicibacterium sp. BiH015]|uniref:hypothetical protein n=1 Tax=Mycolicibacterium sp. BiH015 TaxID=3018808 RepID=UPI0022E0D3CC|nr:hypothetical protein [Mycolicibacterium sp. BiH015]MDA2892807.1 hypothetical protein [Mycolicibacterium sp. BiH015]
MHRTRKLFATTIIAAAGAVSAAVAFSASATAQPAPAPAPAPEIPGLPFLQQLAANPAAATQLMQGFTNLLGNAGATPAATATTTPATPASGPGATASINLPQPAAVLPAAVAPGSSLPGATPIGGGNVTTVPAANTTTTAPTSPLTGLTDSLGLAGLMPAGNPLASLLPTPATAPVAAAPAPAAPLTVAPVLTPLSALP